MGGSCMQLVESKTILKATQNLRTLPVITIFRLLSLPLPPYPPPTSPTTLLHCTFLLENHSIAQSHLLCEHDFYHLRRAQLSRVSLPSGIRLLSFSFFSLFYLFTFLSVRSLLALLRSTKCQGF